MWTNTRVPQRLGIQYPVIQGPFGGGLSSARLVAAVSNGGGLGSFGAHHLDAAGIRKAVEEIRSLTARPFAMNLWVPLPGERDLHPSAAELAPHIARLAPFHAELGLPLPEPAEPALPVFEDQVSAVLDLRPPVFSFIFGIPANDVLEECRRRGIVSIGTATHVEEAVALEQAGVDVIVASGSEAGGHRASFLGRPEESPAVSALVPQVKDRVRTPVVAAGGIVDGRGIVAARVLGAEGVQVGTAFLACEESAASDAHRTALRSDAARHTVLTRVFSGRLARGIRNRFVDEMTPHEWALPPYPVQNWLTRPLRQAAAAAGRPEFLSLWSGQNAPLLRHTRAGELLQFLVADTERVLQSLAG